MTKGISIGAAIVMILMTTVPVRSGDEPANFGPNDALLDMDASPTLDRQVVEQRLLKIFAGAPRPEIEQLEVTIADAVEKAAKTEGVSVAEFLKDAAGDSVADKIHRLAVEAAKQLDLPSTKEQFESSIAKEVKAAADYISRAMGSVKNIISVFGYYSDKTMRWEMISTVVGSGSSYEDAEGPTLSLEFPVDLTAAAGRKLVVPIGARIETLLSASCENGRAELIDDKNKETSLTVKSKLKLVLSIRMAGSQGLEWLVRLPIEFELPTVGGMLVKGKCSKIEPKTNKKNVSADSLSDQ